MLFTAEEEKRITDAIAAAELITSGEIRVYVEEICERENPLERASEVFYSSKVFQTKERNGVLVYLAEKSRKFAIWGDLGIHSKVGDQFWDAERALLEEHLKKGEACEGICLVVQQIGEQLKHHFPADPDDNENELPDDIIYG